jgi:hypothetical protein
MTIREQEIPEVPVCPGCGRKDGVHRYDLGTDDAPLEVCWCGFCNRWLSADPSSVAAEGEGVSER